MKRLLAIGLILAFAMPVLFADEASVMPARVGRIYLAPMYGFASSGYDNDGKSQKLGTDISMFNLGLALEYGISDWISAAVQWVPGWTLWSKIDQPGVKANMNGVADLFVGAKIQVIGPKAPVANETMRLSFAPGVKIPLPGPDFTEELANIMTGKEATMLSIDKHVLGLGLRTYFDYIINEKFFINLYNEFIFFPIEGEARYAGVPQLMAGLPAGTKIDYGYSLIFELEPQFAHNVAEKTIFKTGLPVNFAIGAAPTYSYAGMSSEGDGSQNLSLRPNVSMFFQGWPLPMEFKLQYIAPLYGKNVPAAINSIMLQVRAYFKI